MKRTIFLNQDARMGDTFGLFADLDAAVDALRRFGRSLDTHSVRRTGVGYLVSYRGYIPAVQS